MEKLEQCVKSANKNNSRADFTNCSGISIVDFEQENSGFVANNPGQKLN